MISHKLAFISVLFFIAYDFSTFLHAYKTFDENSNDKLILANIDENIWINCTSKFPIVYCHVVDPKGNRIEPISRNEYDGNCGYKVRVNTTSAGKWCCHFSAVPDHCEKSQSYTVRVVNNFAAVEKNLTKNLGARLKLHCVSVIDTKPLKYCRFISPSGFSFSIDQSITFNNSISDMYYYPFGDKTVHSGECAVGIKHLTIEDIGQWTCAGGYVNGGEYTDTIYINQAESSYGDWNKTFYYLSACAVLTIIVFGSGKYLFSGKEIIINSFRTMCGMRPISPMPQQPDIDLNVRSGNSDNKPTISPLEKLPRDESLIVHTNAEPNGQPDIGLDVDIGGSKSTSEISPPEELTRGESSVIHTEARSSGQSDIGLDVRASVGDSENISKISPPEELPRDESSITHTVAGPIGQSDIGLNGQVFVEGLENMPKISPPEELPRDESSILHTVVVPSSQSDIGSDVHVYAGNSENVFKISLPEKLPADESSIIHTEAGPSGLNKQKINVELCGSDTYVNIRLDTELDTNLTGSNVKLTDIGSDVLAEDDQTRSDSVTEASSSGMNRKIIRVVENLYEFFTRSSQIKFNPLFTKSVLHQSDIGVNVYVGDSENIPIASPPEELRRNDSKIMHTEAGRSDIYDKIGLDTKLDTDSNTFEVNIDTDSDVLAEGDQTRLELEREARLSVVDTEIIHIIKILYKLFIIRNKMTINPLSSESMPRQLDRGGDSENTSKISPPEELPRDDSSIIHTDAGSSGLNKQKTHDDSDTYIEIESDTELDTNASGSNVKITDIGSDVLAEDDHNRPDSGTETRSSGMNRNMIRAVETLYKLITKSSQVKFDSPLTESVPYQSDIGLNVYDGDSEKTSKTSPPKELRKNESSIMHTEAGPSDTYVEIGSDTELDTDLRGLEVKIDIDNDVIAEGDQTRPDAEREAKLSVVDTEIIHLINNLHNLVINRNQMIINPPISESLPRQSDRGGDSENTSKTSPPEELPRDTYIDIEQDTELDTNSSGSNVKVTDISSVLAEDN